MEQTLTTRPVPAFYASNPLPGPFVSRGFEFEKKPSEISLEKTVNNYLKTPAEMDAEFVMEINTTKQVTWRQEENNYRYDMSVFNNIDSNQFYHSSAPPGFIEENY